MIRDLIFLLLFVTSSCITTSEQEYKPNQNPAVTKLIGQASTYLGEGNTDLAQSKLQRALRISPKDAEVYYYLAKLRWQKKEYKQSIGLIDRGLSYVGRNRKLEQKLWF